MQRRVADVTRKMHGASSLQYNKAMIPVTVGLIHDQQYNAAEQVLQNYILPELVTLLQSKQREIEEHNNKDNAYGHNNNLDDSNDDINGHSNGHVHNAIELEEAIR
jgi:hypothetical protein